MWPHFKYNYFSWVPTQHPCRNGLHENILYLGRKQEKINELDDPRGLTSSNTSGLKLKISETVKSILVANNF